MREIKFRAWDKDGKAMYYDGDGIDIAVANNTCYLLDTEPYGNQVPFVVMQYTGLKDKNGKEIYDFDYLGIGKTETIGKVMWSETNLQWMIELIYGDPANIPYVPLSVHVSDTLEVIGNIYENPELLEQGKEINK